VVPEKSFFAPTVLSNIHIHIYLISHIVSCNFKSDHSPRHFSPLHILISCHDAKDFWVEFIKWLCNLKVNVNSLNNREIVLGMPDCEDELFVNHVLLIAKQHLYSCRCKNAYPLINVFIARLKKIQNFELVIAKSKNKLSDHTAKWGKFLKNTDL